MEVDSDEDLTKELQPLAYYVSDRKRVLKEALRTLKGKRLEAMIPPALKSWDRARLESACLNVLEDVDDETLLSILDGRVGTAASAAVEQPEPEEPVVKEKIKKTKNKLKKAKSVETPEVPDEPKKKKKKKAIVVQESLDEAKVAKLKKKKKLLKAKKLKEKLKKKKKAAAAGQPTEVDGEPSAAAPHKSLMELLELEYRAKAIKALLRSQGQTVPDIPLDVEGEEEQENEPVEKPPPSKATPEKKKVNGEKVKKSAAKPKESKPYPVTNVPVKTTSKTKVETSKVTTVTPAVTEKVSPKKSTSKSKATTAAAQPKVPSKKAVIDLIDDALSTSFSEVTPDVAVAVIEPPAVIVQAISKKDSATEEDLRSKLLKKYQQQKQEVEVKTEKPQVKRKVKKKKEIPKEEEDDVLELHPQELSLDGEDGEQEQESSGDEVEEEEEPEEIGEKEESNKKTNVQEEEEQLIYDDDTDEEEEETQKETDPKVENQEENSNSSAKEDKLWAAVEEGTKVEEDNVTTDNELSQGGPPSDNSRSGVFSETTRDDVFETAVVGNAKGKVAGVSFSNVGGGLKKKLTFRIDPARIKALEEQGVEEEAKRDEERKKQEEEERLKRLAEEPEEGELDSNEEDIVSEEEEEEEKKTPQKKEVSKSPSKSPARSMKRRDHSDSEDSQDSTSYYAKRRPYKRKQASPSRDFGKYSPQRTVTLEKQSPEKRPSSPVDFITQFSDMEPISDEDSNQSQPKKKVGPVQGCSERPANAVESESEEEEEKSKSDLKSSKNKAASEEDEDELPKPVTWYERWAQSHGMSKVVKANNIHRKVKSKLKQTKKQPEVPKVPEPSVEAEPIIGSIEEYEKLFGKKVVIKSSEQEDNNTKSNEAQDEEEEEDADDLWGDILGGGDSD